MSPATPGQPTTDIIQVPVLAPVPVQQQSSMAPNTTSEQDLTTAGQRKVNLVWEYTQSIIALMVVGTTMVCVALASYRADLQVPNLIAVAFGTVVGFYFSRTNHTAIGGVGAKPIQDYIGR